MTTLTLINIGLFLLSLFLFFRSAPDVDKHRRRRGILPGDATAACRRTAAALRRIRELNIAGIENIQNATESAIEQFSSLERRIRTTTRETRQVLDLMRDKIALGVAKEVTAPGPPPDTAAIRERYASLFRSVLEQLSLITERKAEEIARLENARAKLAALSPGGGADGSAAGDAARLIGGTVAEIREAAAVEERLIRSTLGILEEVVLSLVDSFIRINAIVDRTLGESSSMGDEIATIMVNLQCEDICQEMGETTLSHLTAAFNELKGLGIDSEGREAPMTRAKEADRPERGADALEGDDNVTFF